MTKVVSLMIAGTIMLAPSFAAACSAELPQRNLFDYPAVIAADCSFTDAGEGRYPNGTGDAPIDLGNGRIAQSITFGADACSQASVLLVVDCTQGEAALLSDRQFPDREYASIAGFTGSSYGFDPVTEEPTRDAANLNIAQIGALAQEMHILVNYDVRAFIQGMRFRNRFDPYCGCQALYPDSPGARQ